MLSSFCSLSFSLCVVCLSVFAFPFPSSTPVHFHDMGRKAGAVAKRISPILLKIHSLEFPARAKE